jgi:outer membrane protein
VSIPAGPVLLSSDFTFSGVITVFTVNKNNFGLGLSVLVLVFCATSVRGVSLERAFRIALSNNEKIIVSSARQQQADESVVIAKSRLFPDLSVSGSAIRQKELSQSFGPGLPPRTFQPEENYRYEVELRHRLYHGGKTWYGWSLRSQEAQAQSFRHFRQQQEILYTVARRYYGVLLAKRNLKIARNGLTRSKNQLERAQGRFEVGEVTRTSVLRTKVSVSWSKQKKRRAENNLNVAYQRFGLALGYDTAVKSVEDLKFDDFKGGSVDEYYRKALKNRWDLRRARANKKAASKRVRWQMSDYFPSVDLVSQYSNAEEPTFSSETENWSVQLVGSYPLFTGWMETAQVDRAQSMYRAARARLQRLEKEVQITIKNIYLNIQTQQSVIRTTRNEVKSARQNYEKISAEFEQGLASSVDVNDSLQVLQEAESRLANARYNYQLELLRLKLAIGTFQSDLITRSASFADR